MYLHIVGVNLLELHGVPGNCDSLLKSILHQLQMLRSDLIEEVSFSELRLKVIQLLQGRGRPGDLALSAGTSTTDQIGGYEVINIISQWLHVNIEIFQESGNRRTYPSTLSGRPTLRIYQYEHQNLQFYDSILKVSQCPFNNENHLVKHELRIGVWNLSGAANVEKRMVIDELVYQQQSDIVCIQESHLYAQSAETSHYFWRLGPQTNNRASRGCGYLVSKHLKYLVSFKAYSTNICHLAVTFAKDIPVLYIICVHKHSEGTPRSALETGQLTSIVRDLKSKGEIVLVGDFNSHVGRDLLSADQNVIGEILHHQLSNVNGRSLYSMCDQLELQILTTKLHSSTKCTWFRANGKSQIDHVIKPASSLYKISNLRGRWTKHSDHKLMTFILEMRQTSKSY